ncbi:MULTISPECIES: ATP-binding protein [unclassified Novosphingobium]|uniref:ATP-binding protein n=1 Tax=unclassified Novosphingobium TaxID=2644732 RepID=UPI000AD61F51|nr:MULTISPECIES: ATP-binding protein [unclassified Novosphingobium]MBN9144337.1 HAMP domain-containing protein [Novosphingobium sp.]MDR6707660.1 two-component system sensor histidine kinase CpxA [Novosphingobium sp. 1748]
MRSIFSRIFLSFWLAMALIAASAVGVTVAVAWARAEALEAFDPGALLRGASRAWRAGGDAGLRQWLAREARRDGNIMVFVLDAQGRDMLGRAVSLRLRPDQAAADSPPAPPTTPGFMRRRSHVLLFSPLPGGRWRLVAGWSGATAFDVLGSYDVWVAMGLLALGVSGAMAWWLARQISHPVVALQASARRLAEGDLGARPEDWLMARRDELGSLAAEFTTMAQKLQQQLVSKDELLRDISHELRSPLTRLRVAAALARQNAGDLETHLARVERDIDRLDRIIGDTLRFSAMNTPGRQLDRQLVDLAELLGEAVDDARIEAEQRRIALHLTAPDGIAMPCDPDLLRRAFDNVLRNAIRHSGEGEAIAITLETGPDRICIAMADRGEGVPEEALERIFEAFYRVDKARGAQSGGAGLGLAITARIAALHGGTVAADNRPGGGLIIRFVFPK